MSTVAVAGLVSILASSWSTTPLHQEATDLARGSAQEREEEIEDRFAGNSLDQTVAETKPNVFFIMIDDMGWGDIGYQSVDLKEVTPILDGLAASGVKITNYYSMTCCTPARASLMTGRYTVRYGMQYNVAIGSAQAWGVPLSEKILPEYMKHAGYETHLVGKWHLGSQGVDNLPTQRGFDTFMGFLGGYEQYWTHETLDVHLDGTPFLDFGFGNASGYYDIIDRPTYEYEDTHMDEETEMEEEGIDGNDWGAWYNDAQDFTIPATTLGDPPSVSSSKSDFKNLYSTSMLQDRAIEILETKTPFDEEPLFMYLAHQATHLPLGAPPAGSFSKEDTLLLDEIEEKTSGVGSPYTRRRFAEVLMFLDKSIGHLMDYLEREGWLENSIVAVTSDNGARPSEGGSNYPLRGRKHTYWEGGVKMPAFVYSRSHIPEGLWGTEYNGLMHVTDWLPTIADAAGATISGSAGPLDGISQRDYIVGSAVTENGGSPRTEMLFNYDPYYLAPDISSVVDTGTQYAQGAFRSGQYKMLFNVSCQAWYTFDSDVLDEDPWTDLSTSCGGTCRSGGWCSEDVHSDYLIDLDADPRETNNLINELPDVAQELRDRWHNITFQEYTTTVYEPTDKDALYIWADNNWWMTPWLSLEQPKIPLSKRGEKPL